MVKIQEKIIEIIASTLGLPKIEIHMETGPNNLSEWDSVNTLRIYSELQEELHVKLPFKMYMKAKNVGELVNLYEKKYRK